MKKMTVPIIVILVSWVPFFMGAFDKDKPAASTSLRSSNPEILANWSQLQTAINLDHEFSGTAAGTQTGKHEVLTMQEESSAGASSTNEGHFQIIDGGSQPELAFTSEDADELQFTKDGDLYSSDNLVVDGTSTLTGAVTANGGITLGAGDDLIGSATSDITFNTNKFTVAGATGNTLVAGTFTSTGVATLADTSALATSGAPAADAQIANKKYVDDQITAGADPAYSGGESHTFAGGLIIKMGFISDGGALTTVTFGTPFPAALISVNVSTRDNNTQTSEPVINNSAGVNSFVIESNEAVSGYYWIAIGH